MEKGNPIIKRVVVISEADLTNEATGMAQTLGNLFDNYPQGNLLFCLPKTSSGKFKGINSMAYKRTGFIDKIFKKLFSSSSGKKFFKTIQVPPAVKKILQFNPDIVLISNLAHDSCLIAMTLLKRRNFPLCVYLMDYISKEDKSTFDSLIEPIMKQADKHIFISSYMAQRAIADYPEVKNWTVIHNPVEEKEIASVPQIQQGTNEITFGYAGSLWPMHIDAVIIFAEALKILRSKNIKASLVIYTTAYFHNMHQQVFNGLEIVYAGFYRFDILKPHLLKHKALLVASSFDKKFYDLSAYSVQTKVTDYLASGVPVIGIGPGYAACNRFIKENNCGSVIQSDSVSQVANEMEAYLNRDINDLIKETENGLTLIRDNYKKHFVQQKLYQFLSA